MVEVSVDDVEVSAASFLVVVAAACVVEGKTNVVFDKAFFSLIVNILPSNGKSLLTLPAMSTPTCIGRFQVDFIKLTTPSPLVLLLICDEEDVFSCKIISLSTGG